MGNQKSQIKKKNNMSNIDITVIAHELDILLSEGFIDNIYEINDEILEIKFRTKTGKKNIIIDPSKRINITNYNYPIPPYPSQYCSVLRKYLNGRRILKVYQFGIDRIIVFEIANMNGPPWKFIVELFLGGNYLLIDENNTIFMAKSYKIMKDRRILAKQTYEFPAKQGVNFLEVSKEEFINILQPLDIDLIRGLSRSIGLVGYLAEELCRRSNIDKNMKCCNLSGTELEKLFETMKLMIGTINSNELNGVIYTDENQDYISFEPFELLLYQGYEVKKFTSFNEAVDDYFSKVDSDILLSKELKETEKIVGKYQRIKQSQEEQIKESVTSRENHLELGNFIYEKFSEVESLLNVIREARKRGMNFEEIENRLKLGKEKGLPEALIFEQLYPKDAKVSVIINNKSIILDFRKNTTENANDYYDMAKNDKRRIEGAKEALKKTEDTLQEKEFEKDLKEQEKVTLIKQPKKQWYEKYRWFVSSDGFVVVGGKDASSNEVLVKKYMEKDDLFFHTELRGAPSVILKNPEKKKVEEIPELTIKEAATFAGSYSNAWREGFGSTKIFYVFPDQVTKSPNPGEYLTKGAFFIKGNKNFLPTPYLELSIGLVLEVVGEKEKEEDDKIITDSSDEGINYNNTEKQPETKEIEDIIFYPRIIAGPLSAVKSKTDNYVRLKPLKSGNISSGKIAEKIKNILVENTKDSLKKWASLISINDIIHFLPPGNSDIIKSKDS